MVENRFLFEDNRLKEIAGNLNGQKITGANLPGIMQAWQNPFARQFATISYKVPGLVAPLRQPSGMVCWATVTTMMIMWKRQQSLTIETAMASIGNVYLTKFKNNGGLSAAEKIQFLSAAGLAFEYPQSLSIEGWEKMMRTYGPIWVTTDEDPTAGFAIHARIISGVDGDGTPANTFFTITDPGTGTTYREKFSDFLVKYEQEARDLGVKWSGRIQIVHWPAATGVSQSLSTKRSQSWMLSQRGIDLIKGFEKLKDGTEADTATLTKKLKDTEQAINDNVAVELRQNQFDALVSFVYNIGQPNFIKSTLLKLLNTGKYDDVSIEMKRWTKGKVGGNLVDMPELLQRRDAEATLFAAPSVSASQSVYDSYSAPFYDTGEHAMLGEFLNAAISGPIASIHQLQPTTTYAINTVPFTYGQIMTLGDFYESYDQLSRASANELKQLKTLVERSENHYKAFLTKTNFQNPANDEWDKATGGRYLQLAAKNNSHFAPPPSAGAFKDSTKPNNRTEWQMYHSKAIGIARAGVSNTDLDPAYKVNAFGDHFLTDAFAAGHLVNKEVVTDMFKNNFLSGGKLTDSAKKFFDEVSKLAFNGELAKLFSKYETVKTYILVWHPNINSASRFSDVLKGVAEKAPDEIGNLAVKAVHDALNQYPGGVPVRNNKGKTWKLTGDGTLNPANITVIQEAVKQSVINVEDSVRNNAPASTFFQRVWDHVPIISNPDTEQIVSATSKEYTNPSSRKLIAKTVSLLKEEYGQLLSKLVEAKALKKA